MPKPKPSSGRPEYTRQVPADSLLQASEAALSAENYDELRHTALKQAPTPAAPSELHRMWIHCPSVVKKKHLCDVLDELGMDDQPQVWKAARDARLLQDFKLIPNLGIRFTCASYDTASKLSLVQLNAFGTKIQISRFSQFNSRYYVDLVRLPDEVTDRMIYDWFEQRGAPPTCILPTYVRNGLTSRERTVYFNQDKAPALLVPSETAPLREIEFPSPDDGMVMLRCCFVNHKVARYNRVTPPSILLRQEEEKARQAAASSIQPPDGDVTPSGTASQDVQAGFSSSLKRSIQADQVQPAPASVRSDAEDDAMTGAPPALDDDGSEIGQDEPVLDRNALLEEEVSAPNLSASAPLWAKAATNRRALLARHGAESVEVTPMVYDFQHDQGTAQAAKITKANYYQPLWFDDLDQELPQWHYDIEVRRSETDEVCLECAPVHANSSGYVNMVSPVTMVYDVETMTRVELFTYIDSFLNELGGRPALDQLATIEANPGIMLRAIGTQAQLDNLALNRAMCRLIAHSPPGKSAKRKSSVKLLQAKGNGTSMLKRILQHATEVSPGTEQALMILSAWDVVLHVMAPTVYHDPVKLHVLTEENPQFLTGLTIPLLTDHSLWLLGFSSFAQDLLQVEAWTFKAVSLNVNGLNESSLQTYQDLLTRYQVIALQETRLVSPKSQDDNDYLLHSADANARAYWSNQGTGLYQNRNGVALLFSGAHPFNHLREVTPLGDTDSVLRNRYMVLSATLGNLPVFLHVVYGPAQPEERAAFFAALPRQFDDSAHHIVFGDFNMTMDPEFDQATPSSTYHTNGRSELFAWMISLGLLDFWRLENPTKREFTGPGLKNRIDYSLATVDFYDKFIRSSRHVYGLALGGGNHIPVEFTASSDEPAPRDALPFKCPPWLLRIEEVQAQLQRNLTRLMRSMDPQRNPGCLLDEHKRRDRIFLSQEYLRRKGATATQLRLLLLDYQHAEQDFAMDPSESNERRLEETRQTFTDFTTALRERNSVSKFDSDVATAETSSKQFFRAPASAEMKLSISSVDTPTGISSDPTVIKAEHRRYWGTLFQSDSRDLNVEPRSFDADRLKSILQHSLRTLNSAQAAMLDAPLTANDFYHAIKHTARGKAPGPDGLPAEYYQLFPTQWALALELVYAAQFRQGRMTKFQRRAYLSLLFKKGSRSDPKNYRPLTLLNQDAKFGPKALAYRLNQVLPTLLEDDQFGFVPGRDIRHALRYFLDLVDHCQRNTTRDHAGAVCLDFAKAFDSVNWGALDLVLEHWGFGENFRRWIKTFFKGTLVQVLINQSRSDYFSLGAGVRQGDPLSPGLFVLFIEPLLCYLRATNEDFAIKIRGGSHHILSFADDVTGLLKDLRQAPAFLDRVQEFCSATGMCLNVDKTVIFPFRPWTANDADTQVLLRSSGVRVLQNGEHTRLLGLAVGPECDPQYQLHQLLCRFQKLCVVWRWRARTLRGRVLLLKTMMLSTLWHFLGTQAVPRSDLLKFNPLMRNFVNNTPSSAITDPAARSQFPSQWHAVAAHAGGLDLPTVTTSVELLQVNLIRQLVRQCRKNLASPPKWFQPAQIALEAAFQGQGIGLDFLYIPLSTYAHKTRWLNVPPYWRSAIATWSTRILPKLQNENPMLTKLTWPLWNNVFLRFTKDKKTLAALHRKASKYLSHQGILRLSTFCCCFGWVPDEATLREALVGSSIKSERSKTTVIQTLAPRLAVPAHYGTCAIYPLPPDGTVAALHLWTFDGHDIIYASNKVLRRLLDPASVPKIPLAQLGVPDVTLREDYWTTERALQQDTLPVFADFLFRLQHNGLGFRYKYGWHTSDTSCVHGCGEVETARHLLWDCYMAKNVWKLFLPPFRRVFQTVIGWEQVLFLHKLEVPPLARAFYGCTLPLRLFNVMRCSVLRTLWMNRNKAIYDGPALAFHGVYRQCLTMTRLHFQRLYKVMTNPRKVEFAKYRLQLSAFKREWLREFNEDPYYFFSE